MNSAGIIIIASLISLGVFVHKIHKKNEPEKEGRIVVVSDAMRVPASEVVEITAIPMIHATATTDKERPYIYPRDRK